jgi:tRNA(Ile)-lysidine synthetase-like protein
MTRNIAELSLKRLRQSLLASFTAGFAAKKIAVAVSGGIDSVALLLLMVEYCRIKKLELCVMHVDHSMRSESEQDRLWVGRLAEKLGLPYFWRKAEHDNLPHGKAGEAWARNFRYGCLAEMMAEANADVLVTGHTADDQAETVLMRMLRGCSLQGLGGIRARSKRMIGSHETKLWRPLLETRRASLAEMLTMMNQDWREDHTNSTDAFFRNRVRHQLVPVLQKLSPGAVDNLNQLAADSDAIQKFIRRQARKYLEANAADSSLLLGRRPGKLLRCEILRQWLISLQLENDISRAMIERLDDLWLNGSSGRKVDYRRFCFCRRPGKIIFFSSGAWTIAAKRPADQGG